MNSQDAETLLGAAGSGEDATIDLARAALAFAVLERPEAGDARYANHLDELAGEIAGAKYLSLDARVEALRGVLVERHDYRGDRETYDDLRNADLAHVIDRRRGLPVALAILWLHTGRSLGWTMAGLNFPGHFLLRIDVGGARAILDPFNEGRVLGTADLRRLLKNIAGPDAELTADHYAPMANRSILLRLQNNIKTRLLQAKTHDRAVTVIERMLMVAPRDGTLWREAGRLHAQIDNLRAAGTCLATAAALAPDAATRQRIAAELASIRGKLN